MIRSWEAMQNLGEKMKQVYAINPVFAYVLTVKFIERFRYQRR